MHAAIDRCQKTILETERAKEEMVNLKEIEGDIEYIRGYFEGTPMFKDMVERFNVIKERQEKLVKDVDKMFIEMKEGGEILIRNEKLPESMLQYFSHERLA